MSKNYDDEQDNASRLNQTVNNLQAMVNSWGESIWAVDKKYRVVVFNRFFANAFQASYQIELKKGMNGLDILSPAMRAFWKPKYDAALNEEYQAANEELIENYEHIQKINKDLGKALEKAKESDRLKTAFLHNMSHEIRTPMNGILGFTGLLKEPGLSGETQQEYISVIQKGGERMLNTINDLMDMSMIESGHVKVKKSEVDVNLQI